MTNTFDNWLNLSLRAPSGDNCQPWQFTFSDNKFVIGVDEQRARHFLDQNQSATWISIGCLCENLRLSAPSFGYSCDIIIENDQSVTVHYKNCQEKKDESLLNAITQRQTYRGELGAVDLDLSKYRERFGNESASGKHEWKTVRSISRGLIWKWSWLEAVLWLKTPLMKDFTKWLRLKNDSKVDGLTLENLQISLSDQLLLMSFKKFPPLIKFVPFLFFKFMSFMRLSALVKKSSGILFLSGPFSNFRDYFSAGVEIQRMWVFMTENKIKAQPLAIQSLFLNFSDSVTNRQTLSENQIKMIKDIKEKTYQELQINKNLIFSFRFGSANKKISFLSRRPVSGFRIETRKQA
jgi:sulfur-carrier protein adenylyltransferase/sulfurtransferase